MASIGLSPGCNCCDPFSDCPELEGLEVPTGLGTFTQAMFQRVMSDVYPAGTNSSGDPSQTGNTSWIRNEVSEGVVIDFSQPVGFDFAFRTFSGGCTWIHSSEFVNYTVEVEWTIETTTSFAGPFGGEPFISTSTQTNRERRTWSVESTINYGTQQGVFGVFATILTRALPPGTSYGSQTICGFELMAIEENRIVLQNCNYPAFNGHVL